MKVFPFAFCFLLAFLFPRQIVAQNANLLDLIENDYQVVYGKKIYAVCHTIFVEHAGSKPGYMKPYIMAFVSYNSTPGMNFTSDIVGVHEGDKDIPVTGKADFEVLAIDKQARGYNAKMGKCVGVLKETGKYFAVRAKVHYDGSKEKADRVRVKYKVKLIDKKKYEKKFLW